MSNNEVLDLSAFRAHPDVTVAAPGRAPMRFNLTIVPPLYVLTVLDPQHPDTGGTVVATGPMEAGPLIERILTDAAAHLHAT